MTNDMLLFALPALIPMSFSPNFPVGSILKYRAASGMEKFPPDEEKLLKV